MYVSVNRGEYWVRMRSNLPTVPVDDIKIHPRENDLILGTHGRGIWIMEDITPLERLTENVFASVAFIFPIRRATSYNVHRPQGWTPGIYAASNPTAGARIRYHLAAESEDVTLKIMDSRGQDIRELEATGDAGLNEVIWDLRLVENDANGEPMSPGPRVMPGVYLVELTTGDQIVQSEVVVRLDPRVELARSDLMARHAAMLDSYRLSGPVEEAEDALSAMTDRADVVEALIAEAESESESESEELALQIAEIREEIGLLEEALDEASSGANVWGRIQGVSGPPLADALWQIERSWEDVPPLIDRVNQLMTGGMSELLGQVYSDAARPTAGEPVARPRRGG